MMPCRERRVARLAREKKKREKCNLNALSLSLSFFLHARMHTLAQEGHIKKTQTSPLSYHTHTPKTGKGETRKQASQNPLSLSLSTHHH